MTSGHYSDFSILWTVLCDRYYVISFCAIYNSAESSEICNASWNGKWNNVLVGHINVNLSEKCYVLRMKTIYHSIFDNLQVKKERNRLHHQFVPADKAGTNIVFVYSLYSNHFFPVRWFCNIICQFWIFSIFKTTKIGLNYLTYIGYLNFIKIIANKNTHVCSKFQ